MIKWEKISERTFRMSVIGGWLILHKSYLQTTSPYNISASCAESMVFVPDTNHEWTVEIKENKS